MGDFHADLKQTVGGDFETGSIEVGPPVGYTGPFNHHEFTKEASAYFRDLVGREGSGIRIQGGKNIRMRNNTFERVKKVSFSAGGR